MEVSGPDTSCLLAVEDSPGSCIQDPVFKRKESVIRNLELDCKRQGVRTELAVARHFATYPTVDFLAWKSNPLRDVEVTL